ncbi:MAG: hypothetical protein QG597_4585 [Actinomycetota bacterium]|nr:hypothetical protein [Actinomycetota bacterium]
MDAAPVHFESGRSRAVKRAGIHGATHHLKGVSADTASRSPFMVPWALYPLDAVDCASLICNRVSFELIISVDELVARLAAHGLGVEVLLPSESRRMTAQGDVLRISWQNRGMIFHNSGVGQFIYELLEPETWARGVAEILRMDDPPGESVAIYANEAAQWTG